LLLPHIALTEQTPYVWSGDAIDFEMVSCLKSFQGNQRVVAKYAIHTQNTITGTAQSLFYKLHCQRARSLLLCVL